jgi:CRISPR-associated endoribonuclease Cas6
VLARIKLSLVSDRNHLAPNYSWAYTLYGALMEKLDPGLAELLHKDEQGFISQFLTIEKDKYHWYITLFWEVKDALLTTISKIDSYYLEKFNTLLKVDDIELCQTFEEQEYCRKYLVVDKSTGYATINFLSPCSFKTAGEYAVLPSKELILQSCINKFNLLSRSFKLMDEGAIHDILEHCRIVRFNLRSSTYTLKNIKVPSFIGTMTISARGPEALLRLFHLIVAFGAYSGIGIKTALGMGGCSVNFLVD